MSNNKFTRRAFIKGAGLIAAAVVGGSRIPEIFAATFSDNQQVPFSAGTQRPKIKAPANACDCHHHIYDPARFPYVPEDKRKQPPSLVSHYRLLQKRLGTTRNVIVQPSAYGLDNSCTLDALQQMGSNARAVAVIDPSFSDAELKRMHDLGVRGIRVNLASETVVNTIDMIEPLSRRVNELGWHVQFWTMPDDILKIEDLLMRLPSPLVFDHLGHLPQPAGMAHPAFRVIGNLINKGKTWVKLSAAYTDSKIGAPSYADTTKVAQAYLQLAPERMLWGSNWPHPSLYSAKKPMVDDALLFDLLGVWAPDEALRKRILVDNPAVLYGFSK